MLVLYRRLWVAVAVVFVVGGAHGQSLHAQTAQVLGCGANGCVVVIDGDTLTALKQFIVDSIPIWRAELKLLRGENARLERAIELHDVASDALTKASGDARAYITELEAQRNGYKELAEGYKKLNATGRWLSLDAGLGITGSDTKPSMMVGVGLSRLRVWGFLQENNAGAMVGTHFPIF
jgi:hypothetical protein